MDSSTLLWTVDATHGSVNFGRLIPFAGNTYELVFVGVALEEVYTAYVMDQSGVKCLAKSEHNAGEYKIAFNTADLRDEFERNMHEMQTFHVIVRDSKRVVAEGDLSVQWQSLWEDTTTGEVFTMRGKKGDPGMPGRKGDPGEKGKNAYQVAVENGFEGSVDDWLRSLKGPPGSATMAYDPNDGKWYELTVEENEIGQKVLKIAQTGKDFSANLSVYVMRFEDQSIAGKKIFTGTVEVPTVTGDDDSQNAANTGWVRKFWENVKKHFVDSESNEWKALQTFRQIPKFKVESINVSGAVDRDREEPILNVVDTLGNTLISDTFIHSRDGGWSAKIGRLMRLSGESVKDCFVKLSIDSGGRRRIDLTAADDVRVPTPMDESGNIDNEADGDNAASIRFVRNYCQEFFADPEQTVLCNKGVGTDNYIYFKPPLYAGAPSGGLKWEFVWSAYKSSSGSAVLTIGNSKSSVNGTEEYSIPAWRVIYGSSGIYRDTESDATTAPRVIASDTGIVFYARWIFRGYDDGEE